MPVSSDAAGPASAGGARVTAAAALRLAVIATTAFLTLVDLFAAQAILPVLAHAYAVSPAMIGVAVNASTFGMAAGGLGVALFGRRIDRRLGILLSLGILAVPTTLLAWLPDLATFTVLRIAQGVCMSTAFTLTLACLGERAGAGDTAAAFAAYITGNVASNLVGRLVAAGVADHFGLANTFYTFAGLNIAGALLVFFTVPATPRMAVEAATPGAGWLGHLRNRRLLAGFGIGFCILFAFLGTFSFVNFVLVRPPLSLGMMQVGLVYFVFLPSIFTTPLAGAAVRRIGTRAGLWGGLGVAIAGLPLLLAARLDVVLLGMVLVAVGTFFAQAIATGYVGHTATTDRGAASGIYLASYFLGGLAGSVVLGQLFDRAGWPACVAGIAVSLAAACALAVPMRPAVTPPRNPQSGPS
jgi:predicted MFS family arabinose efflux permease